MDGFEGAEGKGAEGDYGGYEGDHCGKGLEDGGFDTPALRALNHRAFFVFHHVDDVVEAKAEDKNKAGYREEFHIYFADCKNCYYNQDN